MNIICNKIRYTLVLLFMSIAAFAQPPIPGGGGGGASGTGARSSSIDMYAFVLGIVAVVFAIYFAKNYVKKLAK